jgi:hypothetical protein
VSRAAARLALTVVALCGSAAVAHAYPQFQVNKERTCTACHIAPGGGGLLDGMGGLTAEDISTWEGDPGFLHGAVELPAWLFLGGDFRGATGLHSPGSSADFALIPMQGELYGAGKFDSLTVYATLGFAFAKEDKPSNSVLAREHWLMYRSSDGGEPGVYVRAGRFMPVYGLRYAEHVLYTRRYGGTPLYGETYGIGGGWLSPDLEVHATVFMRDRLREDYALERGDGAALYAEKRFGDKLAIGVEGRFAQSPDDRRIQGGVTAKYWLAGLETQLGGELQIVNQKFDVGEARNQLVGTLIASWQGVKGFMVDLAFGTYDQDMSMKNTYRDAIDLNIHWFAHSHVEVLLTNRLQMIGLGDGGDTSYYSLVQLHYRL